MKRILLLLVASLFLIGCPKKPIATHPIIDLKPPQYVWVCNTHADGNIVCDAVPTEQDVPATHECVFQGNGITACWPKQ